VEKSRGIIMGALRDTLRELGHKWSAYRPPMKDIKRCSTHFGAGGDDDLILFLRCLGRPSGSADSGRTSLNEILDIDPALWRLSSSF
jgi:hypothetical protein